MKFKHNKKRNTAFLYEVLVLELTKAVIANDAELKKSIKVVLKEYFSKDKLLGKELRLYKNVYETNNVDSLSAEKILQESKKEYDLLDKKQLFFEQSNLLLSIKRILNNQDIFSNFIPNYKDLASLSQIFNRDVNVKSRILLENEIIGHMSGDNPLLQENKKTMVPIDNLVLKTFLKKFNEQYSNLHEEQKLLLTKYITSFSDNGLDLKIFLNEEIGRLKKELSKVMKESKEIIADEKILSMTKNVSSLLEECARKEIDDRMIMKIIKTQNLIREINSNDD